MTAPEKFPDDGSRPVRRGGGALILRARRGIDPTSRSPSSSPLLLLEEEVSGHLFAPLVRHLRSALLQVAQSRETSRASSKPMRASIAASSSASGLRFSSSCGARSGTPPPTIGTGEVRSAVAVEDSPCTRDSIEKPYNICCDLCAIQCFVSVYVEHVKEPHFSHEKGHFVLLVHNQAH